MTQGFAFRTVWRRIILTILAVCMACGVQARRVRVSGRVTDENGQPVELATVNDERTMQSAVTDLRGEYKLIVTSPDDTLRLVFRMIGHETRIRQLAINADSMRIDVMLPTLNYTLGNVEVNANRRQTDGMQEISASGIRFNADVNGGSVESIISTQAGVSSHNELSSQYSVRGGNFDENSVYVNGTEILRPQLTRSGQQEGLSFIDPDMTGSIRFSTGGFGVEYADRMSSVLDITYRKPREFESTVTASLLGASAYVGTGGRHFSFAGSIRYKTTSYLLGTLDTRGEYDPSFLDCQTFMSWTPDDDWEVTLTGNIAANTYRFKPSDRTTSFGTVEDAHLFKVYYEGWESDVFNTMTGALDIRHSKGASEYRLNLSAFDSRERETFDILSQYWIDQEYTKTGQSIGSFMQHARNRLDTRVGTATFKATHRTDAAGTIGWGLEYRHEDVSDHSVEWEMRDSAGYTLPYDAAGGPIRMAYSLRSDNAVANSRTSAYIQDTYRFSLPVGLFSVNAGIRASWWSWNGRTTVSPRLMASYQPSWNDNLVFRLSAGVYHQAPFYKEMKDTVLTGGVWQVTLNPDIRSQRSIQVVLGGDYDFTVFDRPFKFTTEMYYKKLDRLIPYTLDNVRIVYSGNNNAHGYATGIDMKLFGEFVPRIPSWLTFSLMNTKECINGKWLPRPTDQLYNLSLYFSDTFPRYDYWKMSLRCCLADGLPFSAPGSHENSFRAPAYRRIDIGLSYKVFDRDDRPHVYGQKRLFREIWAGVDCLNLPGINNVNSYYWISGVDGIQYAIPNYLTGRQLNLRLQASMGR